VRNGSSGAALSKALDAQGGVFSRFYVNMVRAGEAGGALADVLARLAEFMERSKELRESVKSALIYPTILLLVALASVVILLAVVVPQFEPIFGRAARPAARDRGGAGRRRADARALVSDGARGGGALRS
jgi:general secretion pathway protein F